MDLKQYNIEYVIDVLVDEEDRLYDKLNSNLSGELLEDFKAYSEIRFSLVRFREELGKLKDSNSL